MSDAAPPTWVRQLSLPSGAWRCLVGLWGFARYQTKGQTTVYPCRETLAEQTGQTVHAVAKQLRQLAAAGWIHRPGKRGSTKAVLAWAEPFGQDGPPRTEVSPETDGSGEETGRSEVNPGRSEGWTQDGPQTSRELQENFQENVGDAPATRDPQPSENHAHECTGVAARWCPVCGDCTCPLVPDSDWRRSLTHESCPLHGSTSTHSDPKPARDRPHGQARRSDDFDSSDQVPGQDHRPRAVQVASGTGGPSVPPAPAQAPVVHGLDANPQLTDKAQRHAALAAERGKPDNRADLSPEVEAAVRAGRMGGLATEYLDVIAAADGSWYRELESTAKGGSERETWCESLARALDERGRDRLTPEAVGLVLAAWTRLRGGERDQRPRRELWWSKHWPWVLAQLPAPKLAVVVDWDDPYRIEVEA